MTKTTELSHIAVMTKRSENYQEKYGANTIPLFEEGSFCKAYGDAAETCSRILSTYLYEEREHKMIQFPHTALDIYLPKLIRAGHKVIIHQR